MDDIIVFYDIILNSIGFYIWYHIIDIIYDMEISYMISKFFFIWYMIWYHIWYLFFCSCLSCPCTARWCKRWWAAWAWCWLWPTSAPDIWLYSVGVYSLQWKAQGTLLSLQYERPPLQGKELSGAPYDMISYMISLLCYYDIICDIIYDFLL